MTVSSTASTQSFAGSQSTLTFTFPAIYGHPEEIGVIERVTATGLDTDLTYSTHYTVTINTTGIGGTVIVSPSYSSAYTQIVYRKTAITQGSDYEDYSQFPAETLEGNLDRLTMIAQEIDANAKDTSDKVKAWVTFDGTAASPITPSAGYNVSSSVLKLATGSYVVQWNPTMSSTAYAVIMSGGGTNSFSTIKIKDGSTIGTATVSISTVNTIGVAIDTKYISVMALKN